MKCPICKNEVSEYFTVNTTKKEPFTGVEPMEGLRAWGGYDVPRTILCSNEDFVHFAFDHSGEEHLVRMIIYNPEAIRQEHEFHQRNPQPCEHEGCEKPGIPLYYAALDTEPGGWYCDEHAYDAGFCVGCGLFHAGFEDFDFSETGLCGMCESYLEYELQDDDYYDDDYWDGE